MHIRVGCEFSYRADVPTHAIIQVEPRLDGEVRVLDETWDNHPRIGMSRYVDGFGNVCRRGTLVAGPSTLRYDALLEVPDVLDPVQSDAAEIPPAWLPDEVLVYTLPSRFCPSQELADVAWQLFGSQPPGWSRVQAICDWVHQAVTFDYLQASPLATALDVYERRTGVCRDFAHLALTFCRALNIPARYVFGYLPIIDVPDDGAPMDFCAWIEVFLGGSWRTFDPRNNVPRKGRAVIGRGRDALDVAMVSTFGGPTLMSMVVWADRVG
jgi:transglutaminase-like putative cysteine protease